MKTNLLYFIFGIAACSAMRSLSQCSCVKEWRNKAMEKGREMRQRAKDTWNHMRDEAKEKACNCAVHAQTDDAQV